MPLHAIEEIVEDIRQGKMVILMDDEDRENEGDLIIAAEHVRPEDINFMAAHARGLICLTLTEAHCQRLDLPLMVRANDAPHSTNFTVSIEASTGVTTGISAADRAHTIRVAAKPDARSSDIIQPGHIFPIMAQAGGVLSRAGHTEAGCDLARLAGFQPAAAIVEIMREDGTMARRADLETFAQKHQLKIGTIADLIEYRLTHEKTVVCTNERKVNTDYGEFRLRTYLDKARNECHFALIKGVVDNGEPVLTRVHVANTARDLLTLHGPDDSTKLWHFQSAMKRVAQEGKGVLVLICQSESSQEVEESIDWLLSGRKRRPKQDVAYKQVGTGSQILRDLGVQKMRLMGARFKFNALSGFNLEVIDFVPHPMDNEQT